MPRERFFVEVAPGYVRLRHQLGLRTKFGRGRLGPLMDQVVRQLEDLEEEGESIEFNRLDLDEEAEILAAEEQERRDNEELFLDTLDPDEVAEYFGSKDLEAARRAAEERLGRGAKGMSERSRREMWRWVLSLPFEMLGDRPLWITLTYPGDWRQWVPDGPTLERHRRAFGEAWYRGFGERPVGFWSKEFQLAEGRPHLHLLMKGPESMPDDDYGGFQMLTRLGTRTYAGTASIRAAGGHRRSASSSAVRRQRRCSAGGHRSSSTAPSRTTRGGASTSEPSSSPRTIRWPPRLVGRPIAAYMAGEASKAKQKASPDGFGTVGRYFGTFGYRAGFKPNVELMEVDEDVWHQLNQRLTLLESLRRHAKGRPLSDDAKKRRQWQGLTAGGLGPEDYARLYAWAYAAAERKRRRRAPEVDYETGEIA